MVSFLLLVVLLALLILLGRITTISSRLRRLEGEFNHALKRIDELASKPAPEGSTAKKPPRQVVSHPELTRTPGASPSTAAKASGELQPPLAQIVPPAGEVTKKSRTKEEWEALIGGKLLNRIGALALILGVGFFLQYAFVNNWITEPLRVLIGGAVGALLLVGAARTSVRGYQIFSQGLVGSGIAILYLSVYASFNYYHLVSQTVAFFLMAAVTVVTFTQAFRYDSIVVALLGWLGGFLTPFLLSTGEVNPGGLFTYVSLLDAGLLIIAWKKDAWMSIEPLSLAGTYLLFSIWVDGDYTSSNFTLALVFLGIFWGMFQAVHVIRLARGISTYRKFRVGMAIAHLFAAYGILYRILDVTEPGWRGASTLIVALLYMGTAAIAWRRSAGAGTFLQSALSAVALMVLATLIEFSRFAIVSWWAAEGLLLVWLGVQLRIRAIWYSAFALFSLALLTLLGTPGALFALDIHEFTPLWNQRALTFALLAASIGAASVILVRGEGPALRTLRQLLHYQWTFLVLILLGVETSDFVRLQIASSHGVGEKTLNFLGTLAVSSLWTLFGFALTWSALRRKVPALFHAGLVTISLAVLSLLSGALSFIPAQDFVPVANFRAPAFALSAGTIAWTAFSYGRSSERKSAFLVELLHYLWCLLILVLISAEAIDFYRRAAYFVPTDVHLAFMRVMILPALWTLYAIPLIHLGLGARSRPILFSGLCTLVLATVLAGIRGLSYEPVSAFRFVVNERFVILLLVTAGCAAARRFLRGRTAMSGMLGPTRRALEILAVALLMVLVTGEIWDSFAREIWTLSAAAQQNADDLVRLKNLQQLVLSSGWLLLSIVLMAAGLWRRTRSLRLEAIVLFGVSILKIFIYDLSFLDTLYRIFSFLALGVILLAVSYLYQRYRAIILDITPPSAS